MSLRFAEGTTVLLGPNGAGKSTLLGLAASFHAPAAGKVSFMGVSAGERRARSEYRRRVGWMPQHVAPVAGLTVREQVSYAGWLKGMSRRAAWDGALEALAAVGLGGLAERSAGRLSGGQLRRVGLAQALVHRAEALLLDEPTAGLDPRQRETFRDVLGQVAERAHLVVSTHQTEDLTALYASVVVLDRGRPVFTGPTDAFLRAGGGSVERAYDRYVEAEA
ncbi:ATP-binding cassette domain-containing protein [Actinocorallia sp. API 0066]|uniref:ATP-binding cassette domain-containing protein n=1 Tax=Actinocorallia sp. API 0066 TaxID=2896846 RepID=UPI001E5E89EF|nr:ATP-binding cassette domain-containing protein [Actinocorallia sp. API 0066]MCD0450229.1 ATP-binding cassette domain-containing protein [Actinocorallia sp. API 0066]